MTFVVELIPSIENRTSIRIAEVSQDVFLYTIDYIPSSGKLIFCVYNSPIYEFNVKRSDLASNKRYLFINLRLNQISIFYNCVLKEFKQNVDSFMFVLPFLSTNIKVVTGWIFGSLEESKIDSLKKL